MRYNRTEIMRAPLSFGCILILLSVASLQADSRLADAAQARENATVRSLLQQKVDVNAPQPDGTTALHWAVREDDLETADLLIRAGANVKAANRFGATPLSLAATNGNAAMIEKLLKAGEDANAVVSESGDTVLNAGLADRQAGSRRHAAESRRRRQQNEYHGPNRPDVGRSREELRRRPGTDRT